MRFHGFHWVLCIAIGTASPAFAKDFRIVKPPASLDAFYMKEGNEGKWVKRMRALDRAYGGVFVGMEEGRWEQTEKNAGKFLELYEKSAEEIPEWKDYFDREAAREFMKAVQSRNAGRIRKTSKRVADTCDRCHKENSFSVWVRYHWPKTRQIRITDPVEEKEMDYRGFMRLLSGSMNGVATAFEEGRNERAWKNVFKMKKRILELRSVCSKCHVTEWTKGQSSVKEFFVGETVVDSVDRLSKLFATGEPDPKSFWKEMDDISSQSCRMCHLVHQPAAFIQKTWEMDP